MFIREMALRLGSDYLEACLKGMYKEYVANARFVNATSLPRIHFMASCVVELYGIDLAAAYQNAFIFIRQLAIVLRNALTMKTKVCPCPLVYRPVLLPTKSSSGAFLCRMHSSKCIDGNISTP